MPTTSSKWYTQFRFCCSQRIVRSPVHDPQEWITFTQEDSTPTDFNSNNTQEHTGTAHPTVSVFVAEVIGSVCLISLGKAMSSSWHCHLITPKLHTTLYQLPAFWFARHGEPYQQPRHGQHTRIGMVRKESDLDSAWWCILKKMDERMNSKTSFPLYKRRT
jgi:hypothetical protein